MFGCGPKYFSERFNLKSERVYKTFALRMANELEKPNTEHNSVNSSVDVQN